jgi:hypothetical protein
MYRAASEAGIAIEAVAALARHKSLNVAQKYSRKADPPLQLLLRGQIAVLVDANDESDLGFGEYRTYRDPQMNIAVRTLIVTRNTLSALQQCSQIALHANSTSL